ncbi:MAG TPA: SRPBCC family protein [Candidatus Angelobacter sp.]|nr:SRPBCC family protein [Candidatus Angelobacter sp.]
MRTTIAAPLERCFDLSRSIDFHVRSASSTKEQAIGGVTSGLIELEQQVQWRARHFGFWFSMTVAITEMRRPFHFQDAMTKGPFRYFRHTHTFIEQDGRTEMVDCVEFASPVPVFGSIVDFLFLRHHLKLFLQERNLLLKAALESHQWRNYLSSQK